MTSVIEEKISWLRSRIRYLYIMEGLAKILIVFSLFCIITFVIDWSLRDIPSYVRIVFLISGILILLYSLYKYAVYPLTRKITDDDIILLVERRFPELKEMLISAFQLARVTGPDDKFNSPQLVELLVLKAGEESRKIDFSKVVSAAEPKKFLATATVFLAVITVYAAAYPQNFGIWFKRIFGADAQWPRRTFVTGVEMAPGNVIAKGDDITIKAIIGGRVPSRAELEEYASDDIGRTETHETKVSGEDEFNFTIERVSESFSFRIFAGDNQSELYNVTVLPPPELEEVSVAYHYPSYTRMTDMTEMNGHIKAPVGTVVTINGRSNIPIKQSELIIGRPPDDRAVPMTAVNSGQPNNQMHFSGTLTVLTDSEYKIRLVATNGLASRNPVKYFINAEMDTPPQLKVVEPGIDKLVTSNAVIPIVTEVSDDFGIKNISISYKLYAQSSAGAATDLPDNAVNYTLEHNGIPYGNKKMNSVYKFNIASTSAQEGNIIGYQIIAEDNAEDSKGMAVPNITKSRRFQFTVISKNAMEQKIEELILRLKEEIRKLKRLQDTTRQNTEILQSDISQMAALNETARSAFVNFTSDQRKITQGLERKTKEFSEIISDVVNNKLWDIATMEKLEQVRDILSETAGNESPAAANFLSQSSILPDAGLRNGKMNSALQSQQEVLNNMDDILTKLEEWEDYQEVVRFLKNIIQMTDELQRSIIKIK
ncbi:MAG: hypothetical protein HZA48_06015 [Planctomycetes bacterium]|nr:hypothetical protein [Planctomycetota bacterium]